MGGIAVEVRVELRLHSLRLAGVAEPTATQGELSRPPERDHTILGTDIEEWRSSTNFLVKPAMSRGSSSESNSSKSNLCCQSKPSVPYENKFSLRNLRRAARAPSLLTRRMQRNPASTGWQQTKYYNEYAATYRKTYGHHCTSYDQNTWV